MLSPECHSCYSNTIPTPRSGLSTAQGRSSPGGRGGSGQGDRLEVCWDCFPSVLSTHSFHAGREKGWASFPAFSAQATVKAFSVRCSRRASAPCADHCVRAACPASAAVSFSPLRSQPHEENAPVCPFTGEAEGGEVSCATSHRQQAEEQR